MIYAIHQRSTCCSTQTTPKTPPARESSSIPPSSIRPYKATNGCTPTHAEPEPARSLKDQLQGPEYMQQALSPGGPAPPPGPVPVPPTFVSSFLTATASLSLCCELRKVAGMPPFGFWHSARTCNASRSSRSWLRQGHKKHGSGQVLAAQA